MNLVDHCLFIRRLGVLPAPARVTIDDGRSMADIAALVADRYGISVEALRGPERAVSVAHPRQEAMWRMYRSGRFTLTQIARFLGDRDHTTIRHGVLRHEERMESGETIPQRDERVESNRAYWRWKSGNYRRRQRAKRAIAA